MQIVTDQGADLSDAQKAGLGIHYIYFPIILGAKKYLCGVDIDNTRFYQLLAETQAFPETSQPAPGDFAQLYRELAKTDPDILSIHISSGLSGTINSARLGAEAVPEARVTIFDTKTLSCPEGWQVEAAAKAARAGWDLPAITALLERIRQTAVGMFTLTDLKYLVHGGRISHLKGLLASLLSLKPVIAVTREEGVYYSCGNERTLEGAFRRMLATLAQTMPPGSALRVQLLHGSNPEGVEHLRAHLVNAYDCQFEETVRVAPILGAHTGPSLVGLAAAPRELFAPLAGL